MSDWEPLDVIAVAFVIGVVILGLGLLVFGGVALVTGLEP